MIPDETKDLMYDLSKIFTDSIGNGSNNTKISFNSAVVEVPSIGDMTDTPKWKPRNASHCYLAGVSLLSDACGRILR